MRPETQRPTISSSFPEERNEPGSTPTSSEVEAGLPFILSIALISATALSYEILLMRLFSIVQWHHFAYMIISLALLGYGASGTFLVITQRWIENRFSVFYIGNAVMFGLSTAVCFITVQLTPFNPLEIVWDSRQQLYLFFTYLILAIPFFCAANCVGLAFRKLSMQIPRIYRADLFGAGVGALAIVLILFLVTPDIALRIISCFGLLAAALAAMDRCCLVAKKKIAALVCLAIFWSLLLPPAWTQLRLSPYKGLSQTLDIMGTALLSERSSPLGQLSVVESKQVPFRVAPGLSLNSVREPPPQLGVFTDGDSMSAVTRYGGERESLAYLDDLSSALPFHLLDQPQVLVLGAGGGSDVLQALYHDAAHIDAVELNPQFINLVKVDYGDYSGHIYARPEVSVHVAEARSFVANQKAPYDLLQLALVDSFAAASAGTHALNESYLYTIEALKGYLDSVKPNGIVSITRWLKLPPRDSLKLFATALAALEARGVVSPGRHLAMIRSWKTTTLILKNGELTDTDIRTIQAFCRERSFDVVYYPGMPRAQANRYNILQAPYFYDGAVALSSANRDEYIQRYKFNIAPATDEQPYFFHFFRWEVLPELLSMRLQGGLPLLEWGYLILIATLIQALAASLILILLPLLRLRRSVGGSAGKLKVMSYFTALGLAFLFIEIAFIQKLILFLGHPLYAAAVVIAAFLIFAGLGSGSAIYFAGHCRRLGHSPIAVATTIVGFISLTYLIALPLVLDFLIAAPNVLKFTIALTIIAPLAFFMGMPFPLGLAWLASTAQDWIPWAWGINGCASVLSAILATVLAIHFGFSAVVLMAAVFYLMAGALFLGQKKA